MIRLVFLWVLAVFNLLYMVMVADSVIQEYILDKFVYWGFPQWGWMYSSPELYIWFNSIYLIFMAGFLIVGTKYLLNRNKNKSLIYIGIPFLTALFFLYMPSYNWNEQFAIYNAEKTYENSRVPEGKWWVSANKMDRYDDQTLWSKFKGKFGRGEWPGGYSMWGEYRIWLRPDLNTNTKGRRGLVFHGGIKKASPWGIDMGRDIVDFAIRLRQNEKPMDIVVSYSENDKEAE